MLFSDTEDFDRLTPEGKEQYFKYMDHYEDKWIEWDYNVDMADLIESDAKENIRPGEPMSYDHWSEITPEQLAEAKRQVREHSKKFREKLEKEFDADQTSDNYGDTVMLKNGKEPK